MSDISNDIDDLVGDAQQLRVVRAELAAAQAEVTRLRKATDEFVSAYDAYIDAPITQSTAWMDAIARLDTLRDALKAETVKPEWRTVTMADQIRNWWVSGSPSKWVQS
jgi:hypothetical protein